jgi:F420H(2)-dependent quinone reductase
MPQQRPKQLDSPLLPKIFKHAGKLHVWAYRRTGGRIGGKWRIGAGFRKPVPTLLLEHRGRKSGKVFVTDFDTYRSWTDREIPVVILRPR